MIRFPRHNLTQLIMRTFRPVFSVFFVLAVLTSTGGELAAQTATSQPAVASFGDGVPGEGYISGTVDVPSYAKGTAYVVAARQLGAFMRSEYDAYADIRYDGAFRLGPLAAGEHYVAAFIDSNGDGSPDRRTEPIVLWPDALNVVAGETIEGIALRRFRNLPNPAVRTAERQDLIEALEQEAETAVTGLLASPPPVSAQPQRVLPSLRIRAFEAIRVWNGAEDEEAWDFAATTLGNIPTLADRASSGDDPFAGERGWRLFGFVRANDASVQPYLLYIPHDYDPAVPRPLVVTLHGGGGNHWSGASLAVGHGGTADYGPDRSGAIWPPDPKSSMFILSPFGDGGELDWRPPGDLSVLQSMYAVESAYNIDPDRVYLTGYSNGGTGAWELGVIYPDRWAAIFQGGGAALNVLPFVMNLQHMPMRVYHGVHDTVIPVAYDRQVSSALGRFNPQLEYIEIDGYHDIAGPIWENGAALEWLAQHTRPKAPPKARYRSSSMQEVEGPGLVITERAPGNGLMDVQVEWADANTVAVQTQNVLGVTIRVSEGTQEGIAVTWNGVAFDVAGRPEAIALTLDQHADGSVHASAIGTSVPPRRPLGRWAPVG